MYAFILDHFAKFIAEIEKLFLAFCMTANSVVIQSVTVFLYCKQHSLVGILLKTKRVRDKEKE